VEEAPFPAAKILWSDGDNRGSELLAQVQIPMAHVATRGVSRKIQIGNRNCPYVANHTFISDRIRSRYMSTYQVS